MKPSIYLAGALHSASQREHLELIASLLDDVFDVYLPHRDGGLYLDLLRKEPGKHMDDIAARIRGLDLQALSKARAVLVVTTSKYILDPGVCMEVGFAVALDTPVHAYAPDLDTSSAFNPMLRASVDAIYRNVRDMRNQMIQTFTQ